MLLLVSKPTIMLSSALNSSSSNFSARGFSRLFCIARLSGLAPKTGSKPASANLAIASGLISKPISKSAKRVIYSYLPIVVFIAFLPIIIYWALSWY